MRAAAILFSKNVSQLQGFDSCIGRFLKKFDSTSNSCVLGAVLIVSRNDVRLTSSLDEGSERTE